MITAPAVLVTGANRGIGLATAQALAGNGRFHVFAGVRNPSAAAELATLLGANGTVVPLEVTSGESIRAAVETIGNAVGGRGLAGLVNNAGIAPFGPIEQVPLDEIEEVFRVNLFGVVAVTQACLPLLRSARGRIVNVSSANGRLSFPFTGAYSATKFALEATSDALRLELAPWGIRVAVVQPGAFNTEIRAEGAVRWAKNREALSEADRELYARPFAALTALFDQFNRGAPSVQPVADAVLTALTVAEPAERYPVGEDWGQFRTLIQMSDRDRDAAFSGMLG
jgi:NAD(P)-dependent dehydrogenase (short-subunit alcohol dehydrogenase family)